MLIHVCPFVEPFDSMTMKPSENSSRIRIYLLDGFECFLLWRIWSLNFDLELELEFLLSTLMNLWSAFSLISLWAWVHLSSHLIEWLVRHWFSDYWMKSRVDTVWCGLITCYLLILYSSDCLIIWGSAEFTHELAVWFPDFSFIVRYSGICDLGKFFMFGFQEELPLVRQ